MLLTTLSHFPSFNCVTLFTPPFDCVTLFGYTLVLTPLPFHTPPDPFFWEANPWFLNCLTQTITNLGMCLQQGGLGTVVLLDAWYSL
jgi:hypothetical protein